MTIGHVPGSHVAIQRLQLWLCSWSCCIWRGTAQQSNVVHERTECVYCKHCSRWWLKTFVFDRSWKYFLAESWNWIYRIYPRTHPSPDVRGLQYMTYASQRATGRHSDSPVSRPTLSTQTRTVQHVYGDTETSLDCCYENVRTFGHGRFWATQLEIFQHGVQEQSGGGNSVRGLA